MLRAHSQPLKETVWSAGDPADPPREMISRIEHGFKLEVCWRWERSFWWQRMRRGSWHHCLTIQPASLRQGHGIRCLVWLRGPRDAIVCGSFEVEPLPRGEVGLLKLFDVHLFKLCEVALPIR